MSRLILLNKPYAVLCQFRDPDGRPVLADFLSLPDVYPAGRLDHDSEGLLLLTDDGVLQARIADPRWKLPKTYWAQVEGEVSNEALAQLAAGVELNDGPTLPAEAVRLPAPALWERDPPVRYRASIPTSWIALTIREGRNRQVRRMTAAVGFPTLRLVRVAIGPWSLDGLAPGQWREMEADRSALPVPAEGLGPARAPAPASARPGRADAGQGKPGQARPDAPKTKKDNRPVKGSGPGAGSGSGAPNGAPGRSRGGGAGGASGSGSGSGSGGARDSNRPARPPASRPPRPASGETRQDPPGAGEDAPPRHRPGERPRRP